MFFSMMSCAQAVDMRQLVQVVWHPLVQGVDNPCRIYRYHGVYHCLHRLRETQFHAVVLAHGKSVSYHPVLV